MNANGSVVKSYQYDAYGNVLSAPGALNQNRLTYTARERHVASGLYYYRARFYDPILGRFVTQDPIGHVGGMNPYGYVKNDSLNWIDPLGLHTVHYDGYVLTVLDDQGEVVDTYRASSGAIGHMNPKYQNCPNGPIPAGTYSFDSVNFSEAGLGRKLLWILFGQDWGNYRVPIAPDPATEAYIKSLNRTGGYFIHGGKVEGTSGCIDLGDRDVDFYNELKDHEGRVPVIVKY
ncbi:MAG: RHS repeat-associated core domain-containing protein [Candidatus Abyssobacteria bacterium SURF_17]|uniref:RHS repeat-associated core domain-containing protein n=1 Tax=Candidatus Abyssobacteria bacterium SURF_17 TaxID=2093361 RepID=A0A419ENJ0_9BACT|nr:MAG: RHS repeat-associated core domain-containing protein [Candidatus Abyssubacteria bacterium SURF_17]